MWSFPWRYTEATWASSRARCSSPSPSPGWTKWLWATPTPCASGRNRNRRAKVATWVRAPARRKKRKNLRISLSLSLSLLPSHPLQHHCPSTEETPELNLKLLSSSLPSPLVLLTAPYKHVSTPSPQFPFVITITLQCVWRNKKQITAFVLFFRCEDFEFRAGRFCFSSRTHNNDPWLTEALTKYDERRSQAGI